MRLRTTTLLALLGVVLAGCSASPDEPDQDTATTAAESGPTPAAEVGETLRRFVEAAGGGDASAMWSLLSAQSQKELGPTEASFADEYAKGFQQGLGSFAGTEYRVVVSAEMPSGFGVAAVAGNRVRRGEREFAAFGAALRQDGDGWKLELGDPVEIRNLEPRSETTRDRQPTVVVQIKASSAVEEAGLWLDGSPLPGTIDGADGRTIKVEARPERSLSTGWHVVVVFGRAGDLVTAGASPFEVVAGDSGSIA